MGLFRFVFLITVVSVLCKPIDYVKTEDSVKTEELTAFTIEAENSKVVNLTETLRNEVTILTNHLRPGIVVNSYSIELDINIDEDSFSGKAEIAVTITDASTREDGIKFYIADLEVNSVMFSLFGGSILHEADFDIDEDDSFIEIDTGMTATRYTFMIEYTGSLNKGGKGLYLGHYEDNTYVAMNLHPTYARRVFPCMDEPTEVSLMSFTFNNLEYTSLVTNSISEENSAIALQANVPLDGAEYLVANNAVNTANMALDKRTQFRPLQGPPHLWGMVAHNFINVNIPIANVLLYGRQGINNQDAQASVAINFYFTHLNEWTNKPYSEIIQDQDGRMNIFALPDVSTDWHALSTVGIWEPYVFMETTHSVKQRKIALVKIAEAMARQWFGYVIFPENWRYEWVVSGLASYAGWEMLRQFQGGGVGTDVTLLDVNTLFVTEVIQESLLRDSYQTSGVLETNGDLYDEDEIRDHINVNGMLKYKAPALMRMFRNVLGDADTDFIQAAARALLGGLPLETVTSLSLVDAVNSEWLSNNNGMIDDFGEYIEPWIWNNGYPLIRVTLLRGSGVFLAQERFSFSSKPFVPFQVPITYTTSTELNFEGDKIYPVVMLEQTQNFNLALGDEDWILLNIQGQGYYRVTYDNDLWERIIDALEEPERREQIHPLNRATLIDDALNLARGGIIEYDIAFRIVLTMEHETEYAVWKAFVRNMDFLRKRLVAYVDDDEDLDPDIYLRMVRRTIHAFEDNIGFYPDISLTEPTMTTLTRGLVMDHACRANYQPCIAAAVDWFYDPANNGVVNPNIPHEIRPAVYCTMVREGNEEVIEALNDRLEIEVSHYERLVILESLACSRNGDFINELLLQTIIPDSPYGIEERIKIFAAVAESSYANAGLARAFMNRRTADIRNNYGGPEKLEEAIFILAENMADSDLSNDFRIWVESQINNLDDSQMAADRALTQIQENLDWDDTNRDHVYEWIDENHAPTLVLSVMALCVSLMAAVVIH